MVLATQQNSLLSAEPFLKWAGGKTQLLGQLDTFFPQRFSAYHEPFAGSAAVFFHLRRTRGCFAGSLMDINPELINCYEIVRDDIEALIPLLRQHQRLHRKKHYYAVRAMDPSQITEVERAARFIYLNKTCYNGLYRVNAKGQFNVPVGSYARPRIFDESDLRAASDALRSIALSAEDFSAVLDVAKADDLVYFDPPYFTENSGFTGYAIGKSGKVGFGADEHNRLAEVVNELHLRGCHIVLSNSDTDYIRHLFRHFTIHFVKARRPINCNGAKRGSVNEIVVTNE